MPLTDALEVDLFKLVPFNRRLPNWRPDRLLTISPLSEYLEGNWSMRFWSGEAEELQREMERRQKADEKAARAREARKKSGGVASKAPKRRPRTKSTA